MPWDDRGSWDEATLSTYSSLTRLRRSHVALRRGGLRWAHISDNALVYLREHPERSVLVAASRGGAEPVTLPTGPLGLRHGGVLFSTTDEMELVRDEAMVTVPLGDAAFTVYAL